MKTLVLHYDWSSLGTVHLKGGFLQGLYLIQKKNDQARGLSINTQFKILKIFNDFY